MATRGKWRIRWNGLSGNHARGNGRGSWAWLLAALSFVCGTWLGRDVAKASTASRAPEHQQVCPEPEHLGYEARDANVKWLFGIVFFLLFSGLAIHGILAGYLSLLKGKPNATDLWKPVPRVNNAPIPKPPGPQLQISAPMDLQSFRAREDNELNSYGWVNHTAGVVRVPISRAMELVLQEGLPVGTNRLGPSSDQMMPQRPNQREQEVGNPK